MTKTWPTYHRILYLFSFTSIQRDMWRKRGQHNTRFYNFFSLFPFNEKCDENMVEITPDFEPLLLYIYSTQKTTKIWPKNHHILYLFSSNIINRKCDNNLGNTSPDFMTYFPQIYSTWYVKKTWWTYHQILYLSSVKYIQREMWRKLGHHDARF